MAAGVAAVTMTGFVLYDPGIRLEMADRHPAIVSGLYPAERVEPRTFAWSGDHVRLTLPGADRRAAWSCEAEVINWRPPAAGPAQVTVTAGDDVLTTASVATAEATLSFTLPASAGSAFDVRIQVAPTFRPGPKDTRSLGLAFDRIVCAPRDHARARPPLAALGRTTLAAALLGAAMGASGLAIVPAAALGAGSGALLAAAATLGTGPYVPGAPPLLLLSALALCVWFAPIWVLDLTGWRTLSSFARAAIAVSAAACVVKLAFILHQDKPIVDALFHAHRFARVLDGQYYFTQLSTSATPFPYAIGLYVFALPWSALTNDHVQLLRIIVYGAEAGAGLLLYAMLAKVWDARSAGVAAVALFHLVPLPFAVIGNANMTNAFGQSASLAVLAAATTWTFVPRGLWAFAGLALLAALAFISHVSIVVLLAATFAALVAAAWVLGERDTRRQVSRAFAAAVAGAVLAVVLYWGHFGDVYRAPF
ncbi:hypothetical protein FJ250_14025, partial [bacterium]|nr:hypothetical protein [bacterium]